jgi:transcriptional regulator with XRE-family HTH domain
MERIKRMRMVFCKYLYSIAKEKNLTIEDIVKKTNKSYTEVKKILEGLIAPSLDDLLLIAELLDIQVTLNTEIPLGHKKAAKLIPLLAERRTFADGRSSFVKE